MLSTERAPQLLNAASKVQWPLRYACSYIQPVTQCYSRKTVEVPVQQSSHHNNMMIRAPSTINYCLEGAAAITLHFQLQMKNSVIIVSAINPVTTENTDDSRLQSYCNEAKQCTTANRHLGLSAKRNGTQSRTKVSP